VKANVVLTLVEMSGLGLVIVVGLFAAVGGRAGLSRVVAFETPADKGWFLALTTATSLAFAAMIRFEDSVNMAEETKDPVHIFPRMLTGLSVTGLIYVLVSVASFALA
jgi:amino acid transporter